MEPIKAKPKAQNQAVDINPEEYLDPKEFEPIIVDYDEKDLKRSVLEKLAEETINLKESGKSIEYIKSIIKGENEKADVKNIVNDELSIDTETINELDLDLKRQNSNKSAIRLKWDRFKELLFHPFNRPSKLAYDYEKSRLAKKRREIEELLVLNDDLSNDDKTNYANDKYNYMK